MCAAMCWCPGCLIDCSFLLCGILLCFASLANWAITVEVIVLLIFFPPHPKLRFKILNASSLYTGASVVGNGYSRPITIAEHLVLDDRGLAEATGTSRCRVLHS